MIYLESFKIFEKRGGGKILPFFRIFNTLPQNIDYRMIVWMVENWGPIFKKSPYGHSYYNDEKTWDITVDGSLRLADHWNFYSKATGNKIHCKIDGKPNTESNTEWTIGRYNTETETYTEEISFPYNETEKNREKVKLFIQDLRKPSDIEISKMNQNLKNLKSHLETGGLYALIKNYKNGEFSEKYYGKVLRLKSKKLTIDQNGETITFNHARFEHSIINFYDSQKRFILSKGKNVSLN